jgi:vacuolar-type H+-ATPase subunit I/STV1
MIKLLSNATLAFDRGEKDAQGNLIQAITKVGFCEVPDWAAENDYFKKAVSANVISVVNASVSDDAAAKAVNRVTELEAEVAALKAEKAKRKSR